MYCKLGQLCFLTNQGKRCYNLGQLHYYKLGQALLQIGAAITNQGNRYYKIGQLLKIEAKHITNRGTSITNRSSYCKSGRQHYRVGIIRKTEILMVSPFILLLINLATSTISDESHRYSPDQWKYYKNRIILCFLFAKVFV